MVIFLYLFVGAIVFGVFVSHGEPLMTAARTGLLWLPWAIGVIAVIAIDTIRGRESRTTTTASNPNKKTQIIIQWFDKDSDALVGESRLREDVDFRKLQDIFNVPEDDPMYDCYPIITSEQIKYIEEVTRHRLDLCSYDYFLECNFILLSVTLKGKPQ